MKTLTVRLTDDEHARLKADADRLRMAMAPYLLSLWDAGAHSPHTQPQQPAEPKLNKREQAFEKWNVLCTKSHRNMTEAEADAMIAEVRRLRVEGGFISHLDMPMPRDCTYSKNVAFHMGRGKTRAEAEAVVVADGAVSDKHKNTSLEELRRLEAAATTYEEGQMLRNLIGSREQIARDEARERGELED
jgi:hypothetical protein